MWAGKASCKDSQDLIKERLKLLSVLDFDERNSPPEEMTQMGEGFWLRRGVIMTTRTWLDTQAQVLRKVVISDP